MIWLKCMRRTIYIFRSSPMNLQTRKNAVVNSNVAKQTTIPNLMSYIFKWMRLTFINYCCIVCVCVPAFAINWISSKSIEFNDVLCISSSSVNVCRLFNQFFFGNLMMISRFKCHWIWSIWFGLSQDQHSLYLIIYFPSSVLQTEQHTKTHLHYFVIIKLVSTSVPNNLNQDFFHHHPFSLFANFSFRQHWKKP